MPKFAAYAISPSAEVEKTYGLMPDESKARIDLVMWTLGVWLDSFPDRITSVGESHLYRHFVPFVEITYTIDNIRRELHVSHVVAPLQPRVTVFVSYSHRDRKFKDEFRRWLVTLERTGRVHFWDDDEIEAGAFWAGEIFHVMAKAQAAVLLVTQDFIASDFIHLKELPTLLARHRQKELKILWVPIGPSDVEETEIQKLQAIWNPADPLSMKSKPKREAAFKTIKQRLMDVCLKEGL